MIKTEKLSSWSLWGCIALTIIVFACFFLIGYDNPQGEYNAPKCTEALIIFMYFLAGVALVLTVGSVINSLMTGAGSSNEQLTGVPGSKVALFSVAALVVSLVPGLVQGFGESEFTAADGTVTTATMVMVTDMFILSIYILILLTIASVVFNMLKSFLSKK
ncbi:MAG: hypothetical protein J6B92_02400 [Paraprevotella sp.]|nr:hypothetical protein [Paraprevotella sp.]MBP3471459.1 hypothetical protein [Paraprevotella sp.]